MKQLEKGELEALKTVEKDVKTAISSYCRTRVRLGLCDDGDCEFCEMNRAYEMCNPTGCSDEDDDEDCITAEDIVAIENAVCGKDLSVDKFFNK